MVTTYQINLGKLHQNYNQFSNWGEVYFPVKTNHNKYILKYLKQLGSGFECDSIDHIKKVYSKKNANKIIFSNVAKSSNDINWAIKHKLTFYTVDDESTLNHIIAKAKQNKIKNLKINVRLNVYDIFKKEFEAKNTIDSRLGASVKTCKKLIKIINSQTDIFIQKGISFYVQAEVHNKEDILQITSKYIANHFSKSDNLNWINIGGGSSISRLENSSKQMFENLKSLNIDKIILEPGRFMVDGVEDIHLTPIRIIDSDLNGGEIIASLSIGIYHGLLDIKLHNRQFEYYILSNSNLTKLKPFAGQGKKLVLRGPTADSSDVLGIFELPKLKLNTDTIFIIKNIGAYFEVFNSNFSGKVPLSYNVINNSQT